MIPTSKSQHPATEKMPAQQAAAMTETNLPQTPSPKLLDQLTAAARLVDGSTVDVTQTAVWSSSNALLATVAPGGLVSVQASGAVQLQATYGGMLGSIALTVQAPLLPVSVTITGAAAPAASFQLTATARLSDGSTVDVTSVSTWTSSVTATAAVSPTGFVTVFAKGPVEFQATYQGVAGVIDVVVSLQTH